MILLLLISEIRQQRRINEYSNKIFLGPAKYLGSHSDIGKPFVIINAEGCKIKFSSKKVYCSGQLCYKFPNKHLTFNISWLALEETGIRSLDPYSFRNFTSLKKLLIVKNQIRVLENYTFFSLDKLESLNLGGNVIQVIHKHAFEGLKNLQELILVKNELSTIKPLAEALVPTLSSLQLLNIGPNQFEEIKKDDFSILNVNKIKTLDFMFCGIINIHPEAFNVFSNLQSLSFRKNERLSSKILNEVISNMANKVPLRELDLSGISDLYKDKNLFVQLDNLHLKVLYMNAIEMTDINDGIFPTMNYLEELHLNNAHVRKVGDNAFHYLKSLKSLFMARNILSSVAKGLLLPHLEDLDLSGFPQSSLTFQIENFTFVNMSKLKTLNLSHKIISIYKNTFAGLVNLENLKLENCKMQFIEENSFKHLNSLKILNLKNNQLFQTRSYNEKMFSGLLSLETLILSENKLSLSEDDLLSRMFNLKYLDLNSNLIEKIGSQTFSNLLNLQSISFRENNLVEWQARLFIKNKNLSFVDLAKNKIKSATTSMLSDFENLEQIDLSENPFICDCQLLPFLNWINNTNVTIIDYSEEDDTYVCHSPNDLSNRKIVSVHKTLRNTCRTKVKQALLGLLAIILLLFLISVIGGYIYRRKLKNRLIYPDSDKEYLYDAFISYNTNDSDWVFNTFLPHLETRSNDLKLCVYDRDFVAGRGISECILDSIKCSRKTILILSNNFLQSRWCKFETDLAHHILVDEEREGLLLIKLEELETKFITPHINYLLKAKIHLNWGVKENEQEIFWKRLNDVLQRPRLKKKSKLTGRII